MNNEREGRCPRLARCTSLGVCQALCLPPPTFRPTAIAPMWRIRQEHGFVYRATLTAGPRGSMGEEA